jgi:hypothetical protein
VAPWPLDLADVLHRHGEAYLRKNAGRLGGVQRRVMSVNPPAILPPNLEPHGPDNSQAADLTVRRGLQSSNRSGLT